MAILPNELRRSLHWRAQLTQDLNMKGTRPCGALGKNILGSGKKGKEEGCYAA